MKNTVFLFFSCLLFFIPFKNNLQSQSIYKKKIYLKINNIPKIQHKVITGKNSYKIDKSPTITYKLPNDAKAYEIKLNQSKVNLTKQFNNDTVYLKVRYNPGKSQMYILRNGDSATIDYVFNIPYLNLENRNLKKNDKDILKAIYEFKIIDERFRFFDPFYKENKEKEKKKSIKAYNNIISSLDSLSKNDFISYAEYNYYKNYFIYKKGVKSNKYDLKLLRKNHLHIDSYELYLRQYVFGNLKKKTISLGNGMARNSLESFDFVFASNNFSIKNKKHLLLRSLKNIKLDFSNSTYKNRLQKYNILFSENKQFTSKEEVAFLKSIYKITNDVLLKDSKENTTTLKNIIDQNKGKVIYIDFWASWCAPCRQAFPAYKKLRKNFSKKDVVFIFISGDNDSYKWEKAEIEEGLTNSYLALNHPNAEFYEKLNLKSFPRYLIFNKQGELVKKRAPGPDSDNIKSFIDEIILTH